MEIKNISNKVGVIYDPVTHAVTFPEATRFEIIDSNGRCVIKKCKNLYVSLQDDFRTVKIFVDGKVTESEKLS